MSDYTPISQAPTFFELERQADRRGVDLSVVIEEEKAKRYLGIQDPKTKQEKRFLCQNPAIMTYQAVMQNGKPTNKIIIKRFEPEEITDGKKSATTWPSEMK